MDPLTKLRRRPFMAPLLIPLLGVVMAAAGVYWLGTWARTTVVVLVRHAEGGESASGDPDLSPAGEKRVASLGGLIDDVLADRKVDYLYAADTVARNRPRRPSRTNSSCRSTSFASSDWSGLAARVKREHRGKTVVVVGYATTLPGVISQLSGSDYAMRDDEFDAIYVVVMPEPRRNPCAAVAVRCAHATRKTCSNV